jgi:hypothetical protein
MEQGQAEGERTTVPKDHISTAVFHGISISSSGADHIGVPTCVPEVAHSESAGTQPPRSPSWMVVKRSHASLSCVRFAKMLSGLMSLVLVSWIVREVDERTCVD